jgi:hypothetical protein
MYTKVNKDELNPTPPDGYDYDLVNAEVLYKKGSINDKNIRLQPGIQYHILVLQNYKAISLTFLQNLKDLVQQGMQLYGARPAYSLGLESYADNDSLFKKIVDEIWGNINGTTITENKFGKGIVFWGAPLKSVLQQINIQPDFEFSSRSGDVPILYTHRKSPEADIYFIANKRRTNEDIVCTFRISNIQPELWNATTGKIIPIHIYERLVGKIRMPLQLDPYGSVFIVFRKKADTNSLNSIIKNNDLFLSTNDFPKHSRTLYKDVTNNFSIIFWAKPEINILLNPNFIIGTIKNTWTEYYAIYPSQGSKLYGEGHAACGLTIGRNGIAIWENSGGDPEIVLSVETPVSGWSHIGLVYSNGKPMVYLNGKFLKEGKASANTVHPGLGEVYLNEGASYYNGDMTFPKLHKEILSEEKISELASAFFSQLVTNKNIIETKSSDNKPALLIKENGNYKLNYSNARTLKFTISEIEEPFEIKGPWQVDFPTGYGAPSQIVLPEFDLVA